MSKIEQSAPLLEHETVDSELVQQRCNDGSQRAAYSVTSALPESKQVMPAASADPHQTLLQPDKEKAVEPAVSVHTVGSQNTSLGNDGNAIGRPCRRRKFEILDTVAVLSSIICLILGIMVILPALTISWRMGFKAQIITVGFLIGVMNICAERVVPACFLALEARYGKSRLQNYNAILAKKFLSPHIGVSWRVTMILFLALPLALSVGYKQFLGGTSTATLNPLLGLYGVSFPTIGDWTPMNDPIYLQVSSNAAFYTASANDTPILNGSSHYPIAYGYNVLLLSEDSAALLDLPTNEYLKTIRSKFNNGETWQLSASVNAYVAARNNSAAEAARSDDAYWESALNSSSLGLVSYWLSQDANTYIGMLPIVGQPFCWMAVYRGGPTSDDMYSKSLDDVNVYEFRKSAELFSLRRQRCQATWQISASGMRLTSGICDNRPQVDISQETVEGPNNGPFAVTAGPNLPHIFWPFVVQRANSPWLMPTYAVTTATSYWARGVYMIDENNIPGYNYTGIDEQILSTRQTLDAVPMLFLCLAIQPVLTVVAFLIKSMLSLPLSGEFGMIAVLAGIKRSNLDILGGAGFSGQLKRPLRLEISLTERQNKELGGMPIATVMYELRAENSEKAKVPKADSKTVYL